MLPLIVLLPILMAVLLGVGWGVRGSVSDLLMHSKDVEAMPEEEREKN
jgi:hypothetical protein